MIDRTENRLKICQTCELREVKQTKLWPKPIAVCNSCGCPIAVRVYRSCPENKW